MGARAKNSQRRDACATLGEWYEALRQRQKARARLPEIHFTLGSGSKRVHVEAADACSDEFGTRLPLGRARPRVIQRLGRLHQRCLIESGAVNISDVSRSSLTRGGSL